MTGLRTWTAVAFGITVNIAGGVPLNAQMRASERGTVAQTVDGTTISIDFARPQVRGRTGLFGGEVPWGKVWTPGANWATTLDVNKDIKINGHDLAAGTYSVWFEVQPENWTVIFDPQPRRFHLMPPPVADNQVRFTVSPESGPHHELLTWSFPSFEATGTELVFAWAETTVRFDIDVQATLPTTVSPEMAERYTGSYRLQHAGPFGNAEVQFDISYENGHLVADWEGVPNPNLRRIWLISLGAGMFATGEVRDGKLFDNIMDLIFEFTPLEGRATAFEIRALGDALWGTARRVSTN